MIILPRRSSAFRSTASAMEADTSALYWYEPSNVTLSGSNLTAWPDNTGNGMGLAQISALAVPTWNASDYAEFDGTQALADVTATATGRVTGELSGGGEVAVFAVVELGTLAADTRYPILNEQDTTTSGVFVNQSTQLQIFQDASSNTRITWASRATSHAFLRQPFITGGNASGQKLIVEVWANQTSLEVLADGSSLDTSTVTAANLSNNTSAKIGLGAGTNGTAFTTEKFLGNIFEVFATGDAGSSNRSAIRTELATKHGITL